MLNNTYGHSCVLMVSFISDSQDIYILGDTFLRNFYTTLDYKNEQVQIAVSAYAPEGTQIKQVIAWWIIFTWFLGLVVLVSICCCGFCYVRVKFKRLKEEKEKLQRNVQLNSSTHESGRKTE
jgi:hypothetical protein